MKHTYLIFILLFIASCGKDGGPSGASAQKQESPRGYVEVNNTSESVPDLLNVTLDLPVEVSGDRIVFLKSGSLIDQGNRKTCSLNIREQEIWHYSSSGNSLRIETADGFILSMTKLSSNDSGLYGVWTWHGQMNNMKTFRRITLLSGRIIINQDCEG